MKKSMIISKTNITIDSKPIQPNECKIEIEYGAKDSSKNKSVNDLVTQSDHTNTDNMQIDSKNFNSTETPHISGLCFWNLSTLTEK